MLFIVYLLSFVILLALLTVFVFFTPADRKVLLGAPKRFNHQGADRQYRIHAPNQVNENTKLIIGLHGFGDTSRRFAYYTALHNVAADSFVVYPQAVKPTKKGTKTGWNAQFCCGSGWYTKTDDVDFISQLAQSIVKQHGLNPDNVFVTGFSNGAFMAQRLVAERPDLFKAAAVASGSIGTTTNRISPSSPVPILLMHGELDTTVPFRGGVGSSDPDFEWLDFKTTQKTWEENNGDIAPVVVITYPKGGHSWNDWRLFNVWHRKPQASITVVEFFNDQVKQAQIKKQS